MLTREANAPSEAVNPEDAEAAVYRRAANGDHDAQADMAWLVLQKSMDGAIAGNDAVLLALMWSNMAATSGRAAHALAHASVLLIQAGRAQGEGFSEHDCREVYAQALAITDRVADAGHGGAELIALNMASHVTAETIAMAQAMKANIHIHPLTDDERTTEHAGLDWTAGKLGQMLDGEGR